MRQNLQAYKKISNDAALQEADCHQVILMLMRGALERMAQAKGAIERKDIPAKHDRINKAISIINGLQDGLDFNANRDIASNFFELYDYMVRRLIDAGAEMSVEPIDECIGLLAPLAEAWAMIPDDVRQSVIQQRSEQQSVSP